jgi:hypothetical protein
LQGIGSFAMPDAVLKTPDVYRTLYQVNAVAPLALTEGLIANGNFKRGSRVAFLSTMMASITNTSTQDSAEYRQ